MSSTISHLDKINQLIASFDLEALQAFQSVSMTKQFKKGSFLLRAGEVCQYSFLLQSGIARKFIYEQEKEITTEIYVEQDLAVSFYGYVFQKPSRESIECLTDVTVQMTSYRGFQDAKKRFPAWMELDLLITELYTAWLEERLLEFQTLNATQRYEKMRQQTPHLIQQVQLTHLASYLGISLETLSRIRSKR